MNGIVKTTQVQQQPNAPRCRLIRTSLFGVGGTSRWWMPFYRPGIDLDAPWVQRHIAVCPRCQRRFAATGSVQLALALLRSRPMDLGLLGRANAKAIGLLQRSIRQVPKANTLKVAIPEPTVFERIRHWRGSLTQMAACLAIVLLGKIGVFSSIQNTQARCRQAMNQYYANHVGQDLADEVYPRG